MESKKEIKDIAPTLYSWQAIDGYKVPAQYFDKLYNDVSLRTKNDIDLDKYFENLPDKVLGKVYKSKKPIILRHMPKIAAAITVVCVSLIGWQSYHLPEVALDEEYNSPLANNLEYQYLLEEMDDIPIDELMQVGIINEDNIEELLQSMNSVDITDDTFEELLIDQDDISLSDLL